MVGSYFSTFSGVLAFKRINDKPIDPLPDIGHEFYRPAAAGGVAIAIFEVITFDLSVQDWDGRGDDIVAMAPY